MDEMQEMQPMLEVEAGAPPNTPPIQVRFFNRPEQDGLREGMPHFKDIVFCEKSIPGSRLSIHSQPMTDRDKERFPKAWAAFKDVTSKPREGFPIEQWAQITKSEAMNLRAMNIHTLEALAAVSEGNFGNLGQGGRELVARAKAFLEDAKGNAASAKLAQQNEEQKAQIDFLTAELTKLKQFVSTMGKDGEVPAKRGPGRPRKAPEAA